MSSRWHATDADDATAARIRDEYQRIATALGDAAPDLEAEVSVAIDAAGAIR